MEKPNVLFILVDDLGWGDVGYHGSDINTPNIDRLVEKGIELDQHYVCPVCTPTRASLLTGRFPGRFGKHATTPSNDPVLPDGYQTMGSLFKKAGYSTGLFGKWHLGSSPEYYPGNYGFDYSYGSLAGGVDPYSHRYKEGPYSHTWHRNGELIEENGHVTDLITEEAISWIKDKDQKEEPWFCYVPFTAVHRPTKAPEEWINKYSDNKYDTDPVRDRSYKVYAGYTSHMDYSVGRFLETLKMINQLDNTIVVFASDNGAETTDKTGDTNLYPGRQERRPRTGSNYPLRGEKGQLYEGGIRTPGAISWPGHFKPGKVKEPIYIADWMPTFASLLDVEPETDPLWDGEDISQMIINNESVTKDKDIYWNLRHNRFAVRRGDWKLIVREDRNETELYNLKEDPLEEKECAADNPEKVKQLKKILKKQQESDNVSQRKDV